MNPSRAHSSGASRQPRASSFEKPSTPFERGKIFPEPLDEELEGFYKVRVENCRLIVQHVAGEAGPFFRVVFIERRSVVYEMFRQIIGLE